MIVAILVLLTIPTGGWRPVGMVATSTAVLLCGAAYGLRAVERALLAELAAGYSTVPTLIGGPWLGRVRYWKGSLTRMPWDLSGCWVVEGTDMRAPDPAVDPAGLYPSPYVDGRRELWTGAVWSGRLYD